MDCQQVVCKAPTLESLYENTEGLDRKQVQQLKDWFETQPHLPETSEFMLIMFLNACNFQMDKTQKCIECYYSMRTNFPAAFANKDPSLELTRKVLRSMIIEPMKHLSPEGYLVVFFKVLDPSLELFDYPTHLKLMDMRMHLVLREHGCLKGFVAIIDMEGSTLKHMYKCGFSNSKKGMAYMQEALPLKIRAAHYINPTNFIDKCFQLMWPFISEELRQFLHVHKGDTLFDFLPKECVPKECGGTGETIAELHEKFTRVINDNADYFLKDQLLKADDSKRISSGFFSRFGW